MAFRSVATALSERRYYADDRNAASYFWIAAYPSGLEVREFTADGDDVPFSKIKEVPPPFLLIAKPYRPVDFPEFTIRIEVGEEPIWEHRVSMNAQTKAQTDALLAGKRFPDGTEEVAKVYHTGYVIHFPRGPGTLDAARLHQHLAAMPK